MATVEGGVAAGVARRGGDVDMAELVPRPRGTPGIAAGR